MYLKHTFITVLNSVEFRGFSLGSISIASGGGGYFKDSAGILNFFPLKSIKSQAFPEVGGGRGGNSMLREEGYMSPWLHDLNLTLILKNIMFFKIKNQDVTIEIVKAYGTDRITTWNLSHNEYHKEKNKSKIFLKNKIILCK